MGTQAAPWLTPSEIKKHITNSDSTEINLLLASSDQGQFSDVWSSSTLGKAVLQGRKLTNEKPKYLIQQKYDVINIDFIKSPRDCPRRNKYSRKRITNIYSPKPSPIFFKSGITVLPCAQYSKKNCQQNRARKKGRTRNCPLRIAELAVPSKRQCLNTWRSKHSILPAFMVERLKQQVLDQTPIAQISDAIHCFKKRKHSPPKRIFKNKKNVNYARNRCEATTKALCAIFGYKMARYLNKPVAISLTPRLERISHIIADEIIYLLRKKMCLNTTLNQRILCEMAGKVSIWIALILEESTYNLQVDELNDLEEEIGPVLNFIDDLIENVLDICVPNTFDYIISDDYESDKSSLQEDYAKESISNASISEETQGTAEVVPVDVLPRDLGIDAEEISQITDEIAGNAEIISISSFFRNEIYDIILNIDKEYDTDLKEENLIVNIPQDVAAAVEEAENDTDKFLDSLELQPTIESTSPSIEDVSENLYEQTIKEATATDNILTDLLEPNIEEHLENKNDSTDLNVSEKSEIHIEEADDINKKVKFSDIDLGNKGQLEVHSDTHFLDGQTDLDKEQVSWNSSADNIKKSSIIFAPPNENLLSDADESWPEKIPSPVLRPSESISRSVTSLGKILETDEKLPVSSESDNGPKQYNEEVDRRIRNTIESLKTNELKPMDEKKQNKDKNYFKKKKEVDLKEKVTKPLQLQKRIDSRDSRNLFGTRKLSLSKKTETLEGNKHLLKTKHKQSLQAKDNLNKNKNDKKYTNKTGSFGVKSIKTNDQRVKPVGKKHIISPEGGSQTEQHGKTKETPKSQPQPHRDYRVNEATAPTWLTRKRLESHKDLTFGVNQYEMRKWCTDLEHEFAKFEMWTDWLKCTCRDFATMRNASPGFSRTELKNWLRFKRNIDKNISMWAKLNRRAHHKLNNTIYICVKASEVPSPNRYGRHCIGRNVKKSQSSPHCSTYKKF